jgi:nucleoside-diphosphate-sugar epimerase
MAVDVVVFGGSGFIGSSLVAHLSSLGYRVRVADINPPKNSLENVVFRRCDVRDGLDVFACLADASVAINAAIIQIPRINEEPVLGYQVNVVGAQNICEAVSRLDGVVGVVQAGTWHTIGETGLEGVVDEEFGYRPDKVEERAKIYALSKVCQESVVRLYSHMYPGKSYVVLRTGTVLGPGMPELTAASIFIRNALSGKPLTPYKHSMYRPMLFVDVEDVCKAYEVVVGKVLEGGLRGVNNVFNIVYPEPVTVIELAEYVKQIVYEETSGKINPSIEVVDKGLPSAFIPEDKHRFQVKIEKAKMILGLNYLKSPFVSLRKLVRDIIFDRSIGGVA